MFRMCNYNFLSLDSQCCYLPLLFTLRAFGLEDTNCSQIICYYIRRFRSAQENYLTILANKEMNNKYISKQLKKYYNKVIY